MSKSIFQLDKICRDLQIQTTEESSKKDIVELVKSEIEKCLQKIPLPLLQNPPKVLERLISEREGLSEQQKNLVLRIEDSFFQVRFFIPVLSFYVKFKRSKVPHLSPFLPFRIIDFIPSILVCRDY